MTLDLQKLLYEYTIYSGMISTTMYNFRGPFITALGRTWCPPCFICHMGSCNKSLQDVGFVEEKGDYGNISRMTQMTLE